MTLDISHLDTSDDEKSGDDFLPFVDLHEPDSDHASSDEPDVHLSCIDVLCDIFDDDDEDAGFCPLDALGL